MARRAKNKRRNSRRAGNLVPTLKKGLLSRKTLIVLIIAGIFFTCFILVRNYLCNSPEFIVKETQVEGESIANSYLSRELSDVGLDDNIFALSIKNIEKSIKNSYFEIKDIRVERIFPNKLILYVIKRKAIALIGSKYHYPVDEEGMVLKDVSRTRREGLPLIRGIYLTKRDIGKKCASPKLAKSLKLLKELAKSNIPESYDISEIDAAGRKNLSFYIDDGLEIKIGGDNFRNRLKQLGKVLNDPDIDLKGIRYIDLRFKDVVIGPK